MTCSIEGCEGKVKGRGWCHIHYMRWWHHGDPMVYKLHNKTDSPEYTTWRSMINRCEWKEHKNYKYYGARGIKVCQRWRDSFKLFYSDMGPRPFDGAQIDRVDNDGNYEPENCRWITCTENNRRSSSTKLTMDIARDIRDNYKDSGLSQKAFGKLYGADQSTVSRIIHNVIWREI